MQAVSSAGFDVPDPDIAGRGAALVLDGDHIGHGVEGVGIGEIALDRIVERIGRRCGNDGRGGVGRGEDALDDREVRRPDVEKPRDEIRTHLLGVFDDEPTKRFVRKRGSL